MVADAFPRRREAAATTFICRRNLSLLVLSVLQFRDLQRPDFSRAMLWPSCALTICARIPGFNFFESYTAGYAGNVYRGDRKIPPETRKPARGGLLGVFPGHVGTCGNWYLVEPGGFEPPSASTPLSVLHA